MFNIKKKRIIRKIFFIIIFIYNEKFILNASIFWNNRSKGSVEGTTHQMENTERTIANILNIKAQGYRKQAEYLMNLGRFDEALREFEKIGESCSDAGSCYLKQAQSCSPNNTNILYENAKYAHENAIKAYKLYVGLINIFNQNANHETGEARKKIAKEYYNAGFLYKKQAELFEERNDIEEAAEQYMEGRTLFNNAARLHKKQAQQDSNDPNRAEEEHKKSEECYKNAECCYKKQKELFKKIKNQQEREEELAEKFTDSTCKLI